ncbi:MAG: PKD domain-containing protein [Candidatus Bathyarchaeota archaeon]|nr:MAG: PKD domain-containing protein [Candidatus Bathyarchaeota archaeon]
MRFRVVCILAVVSYLLFSVAGVAQASVNNPPNADPNGPYTGYVGYPVTFDGTGSSDPDGDPLSYEWQFGDGTLPVSDTSTPSHTYSVAATYTVQLTVIDGRGGMDIAYTTATITATGWITAHKFEDNDNDGVQDAGEPDIPGWMIELHLSEDGGTTWTKIAEGMTGSDGKVTFSGLSAPKLYRVVEEERTNWVPTTLTSFDLNLEVGMAIFCQFGNVYQPTSVPEFDVTIALVTSLAAIVYIALRKRIGKNLE